MVSYVRSGENSDVYLYGSGSHLELAVAHNRGAAGTIEMPVPGDSRDKWDAWWDDVIPFENPYAGKSMSFETYSGCIETLEMMKATGVRVPDYVFDRLRSEQASGGDIYSP